MATARGATPSTTTMATARRTTISTTIATARRTTKSTMMATARRATMTTMMTMTTTTTMTTTMTMMTTTTMATGDGDNEVNYELATEDDGQGTRPGGNQRRHSAFIRCNN